MSLVNAQYNAIVYHADIGSSRNVFQLFKIKVFKEYLHGMEYLPLISTAEFLL